MIHLQIRYTNKQNQNIADGIINALVQRGSKILTAMQPHKYRFDSGAVTEKQVQS